MQRSETVRGRGTPTWAALLGIAGAAWAVTVAQARHMGAGPGTMDLALAPFLVVWLWMMTAMMFPSVAPFAILWTRTITGAAPVRLGRTVTFLSGYLAAWTGYGLTAFAALSWSGRLAESAPGAAPWVGAGIYAAIGVYQLTPLKQACLRRCRTPIGLLLRYSGYRGTSRDVRAGLHHGLTCVACCWGLMAALIAVGVMNLGAMVVLAGAVYVEKVWSRGPQVARVLGVGFLVLAALAPYHPWLVPGFGSMSGPMPMGG